MTLFTRLGRWGSREGRFGPSRSSRETSRRRRTAAVAFVVAATGLALLVQAFARSEQAAPTSEATNGRIAFSAVDGTTWQIYSVELDGSGLTQLTHVPDTEVAEDPVWSPDGARIAYVVDENGGNGPTKIWVMNADGSDPRLLIEGAGSFWSPAWSPDGNRIAFAHGDPSNLYVVNSDGTDLTQVTQTQGNPPVGSPSWSPDGSRIVVGGEGEVQHLYVMNADGTGLTPLLDQPGFRANEAGFEGFPAWSPDGSTIAITTASGIYAVNPDGTGLREVTSAGQSPAWSPDGSRIVFMAPRPGTTEDTTLFVMNANGGDVGELSGLPEGASFPSWQPVPAEPGHTS